MGFAKKGIVLFHSYECSVKQFCNYTRLKMKIFIKSNLKISGLSVMFLIVLTVISLTVN